MGELETYDKNGKLIGLGYRSQSVENKKIKYMQHLLLSVGKPWAYADELAKRLFLKPIVDDCNFSQQQAIINWLRAKQKDMGLVSLK